MSKKQISLFMIGAGGLCLLLWASSWLRMSGISIPISPSGHRIDVGVNAGQGHIVCFNAEALARPFVYAEDSNWQRPSRTGAPGQWQTTVPLLWFAVPLFTVGGILLIFVRSKVSDMRFNSDQKKPSLFPAGSPGLAAQQRET